MTFCHFLRKGTQMKKVILALLLVAGFSAAHAEITGNAALTSDYRFRGVSQTQNAPAIQGGVDVVTSTGLYVGNWNSSISSELYPGSAGVESDIYAGFKKDFGDITVDAGVIGYMYPRTTTDTNTTELYVGVGFNKMITAKYSRSISNYFGVADSKNSSYIQADANVPVAGKLSAVAHYGRTSINNNAALDYVDYNVGAAYDMQGWIVAAKYHTNTNKGANFETAATVNGQKLYKDAVVVSVSRSF
jgi:uncharacterized protein (TIGR02001 family)